MQTHRTKRVFFLTALAMVAVLALIPAVGHSQALYGCDRDARLFIVDLATGSGTLVCELPTFMDPGATEIEHEAGGVWAYVQSRNGVFSAQAFDVFRCSALGNLVNNGGAFNGLEYVDGVLYGTSIPFSCQPSELRILDPDAGSSTLVGATGLGPVGGLAWDPITATMYGITGCSQQGFSDLVTIDLATGLATLVGSTGMTAGSLEFGPDGMLYAGGDNSDGGNLYLVDPADGSTTLVGATGFGSVTGLTYVDISFVPAEIAIKPQSCPNAFSIKSFKIGLRGHHSHGVLPVALIGSATVDVMQVDVATVTLEGVSPVSTYFEDIAGAASGGGDGDEDDDGHSDDDDGHSDDDDGHHHHHHHTGGGGCSCERQQGDGTTDLVAEFKNADIAAVIDPGFLGDVRVLTMRGAFLDGTPFEATDCIVFVGRIGHYAGDGDSPPDGDLPRLYESTPNPFNPVTRIAYELPQDAFVTLAIYDVRGQLVEQLVSRAMPSGRHVVEWTADRYPSGIYFSRLVAGGSTQTRKIVLLK